MWMWKKFILMFLLISVFFSNTAQASWSNKYDPVCVSSLERRGVVEIAEVTVFNAEEKVLILEFQEGAVMLSTPPELVDIIITELERGFTPVGAIMMYGGEKWSSITTATFTNDDNMAIDCGTYYLLRITSDKYRDYI